MKLYIVHDEYDSKIYFLKRKEAEAFATQYDLPFTSEKIYTFNKKTNTIKRKRNFYYEERKLIQRIKQLKDVVENKDYLIGQYHAEIKHIENKVTMWKLLAQRYGDQLKDIKIENEKLKGQDND